MLKKLTVLTFSQLNSITDIRMRQRIIHLCTQTKHLSFINVSGTCYLLKLGLKYRIRLEGGCKRCYCSRTLVKRIMQNADFFQTSVFKIVLRNK